MNQRSLNSQIKYSVSLTTRLTFIEIRQLVQSRKIFQVVEGRLVFDNLSSFRQGSSISLEWCPSPIGPLRLGFEADLGLADHLQASIINYSLILDAISSFSMVETVHSLNLQYVLTQDSFYR